jgi:hypothetical protein
MSRENVEVVRRIFEEGEEGLFDRDSARILDFWDARGDYYPVETFPESRPCHGAEEIARFFSEFQQAWQRYEVRIKAITPVGDDRVLVHSRQPRGERAASTYRLSCSTAIGSGTGASFVRRIT